MSSCIRDRRPSLRVFLLAGLLILAAVIGDKIEHVPTSYRDSALLVFSARTTPSADSPLSTVSGSLVTTGAAIVENGTSAQAEARVRAAGGTAYFRLTLLNFYNQDYPEYTYPIATLMTQASDPAVAQRTFGVVLRLLRQLLAARQARVRAHGRISLHVAGATGPVTQPGSLKRSLAALCALTLILMGLLSGLLQRHSGRLPALRRRLARRLASPA